MIRKGNATINEVVAYSTGKENPGPHKRIDGMTQGEKLLEHFFPGNPETTQRILASVKEGESVWK